MQPIFCYYLFSYTFTVICLISYQQPDPFQFSMSTFIRDTVVLQCGSMD